MGALLNKVYFLVLMADDHNKKMFSQVLLWLHFFLLTKAVAYDNLAPDKDREQSSTHFDAGKAENGNDGDPNNGANYPGNSCIHTLQSTSIQEAWWRVNIGFITRIHEIIITYRQGFAANFAGFSIFVSNSSDFKSGIRCFKQSGSLPDVETTSYPCTAIGQFLTIYNDRFSNTSYPADYNTYGAVLELCEVEVPGCNPQHYGQNCNNDCFCQGLTCDYKTGHCHGDCIPGYTGDVCNTSCVSGYFGDKCLSRCLHCGGDKTCNQSGVCTQGCEVGYFPGQFPGCPQTCGQCVGVACNEDGTCPNGCKSGYHLSTCNGSCPRNCNNDTCAHDSLNCLSCKDGYYGPKCDQKCPANCSNEKCTMNTGHCLGCEPGRFGHNCSNQCLHCGGNKTCNEFGFCLNGCQRGYFSDYSPGCRLKRDGYDKDMTSNLTVPLVIGITSAVLLVLVGTILNVIFYRRKRAHTETKRQIYMQAVVGQPTEHTYSDIQQGIQNTDAALGEDSDNGGTSQKAKLDDMKTDQCYENLNI